MKARLVYRTASDRHFSEWKDFNFHVTERALAIERAAKHACSGGPDSFVRALSADGTVRHVQVRAIEWIEAEVRDTGTGG
jgi:hypothetical protein